MKPIYRTDVWVGLIHCLNYVHMLCICHMLKVIRAINATCNVMQFPPGVCMSSVIYIICLYRNLISDTTKVCSRVYHGFHL